MRAARAAAGGRPAAGAARRRAEGPPTYTATRTASAHAKIDGEPSHVRGDADRVGVFVHAGRTARRPLAFAQRLGDLDPGPVRRGGLDYAGAGRVGRAPGEG
ncbi:hypothetical protein [Streptomyces sp. KN37]|uniref:hypothetical protein n=1 Tax=Streptomyces sp. KN37 TaxID=3090667 RepID=UPI002A74CD05|nr:hypothetical protein [Streptomyces sp. KN37]WPO75173.1 hypothetical protein R9806_33495 [Streptomyces sp. KN37]